MSPEAERSHAQKTVDAFIAIRNEEQEPNGNAEVFLIIFGTKTIPWRSSPL